MIDLENCISITYLKRQQVWDWAAANGICVEIWGINLATAEDIWHIDNEQNRIWAALKWTKN